MIGSAAQEFLRGAAEKAGDITHRQIIRRNMETYQVAAARGRQRFADWEAARDRCAAIKRDAIAHLDSYLEQFERQVLARGGQVFWAETGEQVRQYIGELAQARGVKRIVKAKSMVTEEVHLTPALEKLGIEVLETDLGEFIVQLRHEPPYHIVTPAMHLTRTQIAELFREKLSGVERDDPEHLVAAARRTLRQAFFAADMGITGANFLVADTGMVAVSTNEGNGRLCTTLPHIHVVVAGIEKVIPRMEHLADLWPTLATAGTGQPVTTYNTLIGGPRKPGEIDGPQEFHVILLDNGRTELLADGEQREVLCCIRCGACLNACPVYRTVGGHTYATTYQGPIGSVLTPHLRGPEFDHLAYASSLCGACTQVCPVHIGLHHHLLRNRRNAVVRSSGDAKTRLMFRIWRWAMLGQGRFAVAGSLARIAERLSARLGLAGSSFDPLRAWSKYHAPLPVPRKSFRALWRESDGSR